MKKSFWVPAIVAALFLAGGLLHAAGEKASVTGEVIDSACYLKSGAKGADHAKCAAACAKNGIPLALLTDDGKVVMIASSKDAESGNALLTDHIAKKVTVEGTWYEKGGAKVLYIDKVTASK
jgi:hypothetical protein